MFTGIVTDIGTIQSVTPLNHGVSLRIKSKFDPASIDLGASICCSGTCLTVTRLPRGDEPEHWFEVEAWEEALRLTTISAWKTGSSVNLERSLKIGDELGGHLVSGHVDGVARIVEITDEGDARRFVLRAPDDLSRFIAPKGSVALDGTSLTVNSVDGASFDVLLIRHSMDVTTWSEKRVDDEVNLEVDQMARYAERLIGFRAD